MTCNELQFKNNLVKHASYWPLNTWIYLLIFIHNPTLFICFCSHSFLSMICSLFIYFLSSFHSHSFLSKRFLSDICFSYSSSSFFPYNQFSQTHPIFLIEWVTSLFFQSHFLILPYLFFFKYLSLSFIFLFFNLCNLHILSIINYWYFIFILFIDIKKK